MKCKSGKELRGSRGWLQILVNDTLTYYKLSGTLKLKGGYKMGKEKLMSIQETSEMLNVSANSLRRWIKEGMIKAVKLGRLWCVKESEVERLSEQGLNVGEGV